MRSYRLHTLDLRSALRKARPLEGSAYARLKRKLDRIPAKIKRPVETFRPQERLRLESVRERLLSGPLLKSCGSGADFRSRDLTGITAYSHGVHNVIASEAAARPRYSISNATYINAPSRSTCSTTASPLFICPSAVESAATVAVGSLLMA